MKSAYVYSIFLALATFSSLKPMRMLERITQRGHYMQLPGESKEDYERRMKTADLEERRTQYRNQFPRAFGREVVDVQFPSDWNADRLNKVWEKAPQLLQNLVSVMQSQDPDVKKHQLPLRAILVGDNRSGKLAVARAIVSKMKCAAVMVEGRRWGKKHNAKVPDLVKGINAQSLVMIVKHMHDMDPEAMRLLLNHCLDHRIFLIGTMTHASSIKKSIARVLRGDFYAIDSGSEFAFEKFKQAFQSNDLIEIDEACDDDYLREKMEVVKGLSKHNLERLIIRVATSALGHVTPDEKALDVKKKLFVAKDDFDDVFEHYEKETVLIGDRRD